MAAIEKNISASTANTEQWNLRLSLAHVLEAALTYFDLPVDPAAINKITDDGVGLQAALEAAGLSVQDRSDLLQQPWSDTPRNRTVKHVANMFTDGHKDRIEDAGFFVAMTKDGAVSFLDGKQVTGRENMWARCTVMAFVTATPAKPKAPRKKTVKPAAKKATAKKTTAAKKTAPAKAADPVVDAAVEKAQGGDFLGAVQDVLKS